MKIYFTPQSRLGTWSLWFIVAMPILFFVGASVTRLLYPSAPAGNTITEDLSGRPALALSMLAGMVSGILAFITGLIAVTRQKERAFFVYVATITGALLILFLAGEVLFQH